MFQLCTPSTLADNDFELTEFCKEGARHHREDVPGCVSWNATKSRSLMMLAEGKEPEEDDVVMVAEFVLVPKFLGARIDIHSLATNVSSGGPAKRLCLTMV